MKALDSFIQQNQPKKRVSKLDKFKDEILELDSKNYQIEQIQEYLKTQNIEISRRWLYAYVKKIKQNLSEKNFSLKTQKNETVVKVKSDKQNTKAINAYKAKMQKIANKE